MARKRQANSDDTPVAFDPASMYADTLDEIEKRQNFEPTGLESIPPMSTGMLALDMMTGGGIRPSWYTAFGMEQGGKTTSAITVLASSVGAGVPLVSFVDYEGSTGQSLDYIQNILRAFGIKLSVDQLFGRRDEEGKWEIQPRVRYRQEAELEAFFDYVHAILAVLPDKRRVRGKWWLRFAENKKNRAKYGEHADPEMAVRHGAGIWVPAPDGNLQALFLVDSYPGMLPAQQDTEEGTNALALQARSFSQHIPRVKGRLGRKMVAILGINQLRDVPMAMFGPKEKEPGGNALKLYSDVRIKHTSRSLSFAEFGPKAGKDFNEQEPSVEFEGGFDKYRYIAVKAIKNKISVGAQREHGIRIWIEDGNGQARGLCPVYDTMQYLKTTGQVTGTRKGLKLNLDKLGAGSKPIPWQAMKRWILGSKDDKIKTSKALGYAKPFCIRKFCFAQVANGTAEKLYTAAKQAGTKEVKDEE